MKKNVMSFDFGKSSSSKKRSSWRSLLPITITILVLISAVVVTLSVYNQEKCTQNQPCANKQTQNCCSSTMQMSKMSAQQRSNLKNGTQAYPCNNCYQPWSYYGGIKNGIQPEDVCAGDLLTSGLDDCRLNRTNEIYTKCRGVDTFDILL